MSDITWTNDTRRLSQLIPWPRNPRQIKGEQVRRLQESFLEFGQPEVIAVGPGNEVYNGHQRLKSWAARFGDIEVDVRVSSRPLSEKEREKLTVFLHRGAVGEWDFDLLANGFELDELVEWGFDLGELGLDAPVGSADAEPQVDRAEELRERWGTATGQLWRVGAHRIICGDCTDAEVVARVMGGERADLLLSDPPYGKLRIFNKTGAVGNAGNNLAKVKEYGAYHGEGAFDIEPMLKAIEGLYDKAIIWGGNYFANILPITPSWLVWDKRAGEHNLFYAECELAWSNLGITAKVFDFVWQGMIRQGESIEREHPTQKPVKLYEWCLTLAENAKTVFDPTLGSGTTMVACENLGRRCRAVEISPAYTAVCLQRMATAFPGIVIERIEDATGAGE